MKRIQRILAMATVIILVLMVFVTLYLAVTASPYFMASMFMTLTLPLLIYGFLFIYRLAKGSTEDQKKEDKKQ